MACGWQIGPATMSSRSSLSHTIGVSLDRVDYLQTLCDLRNRDVYTGDAHISDEQAAEAVEEASRLAADVVRWIEARKLSR